jgi:hypothetical protein
MRDDKPAAAVTEEPMLDVENGEPIEAETGSTRVQPGRRGNVTLSGQKISNARCVIDPVTGLKKIVSDQTRTPLPDRLRRNHRVTARGIASNSIGATLSTR